MANADTSAAERGFYETAFADKFGLTADERVSLHSLSQEFQVALAQMQSQSQRIYTAATARVHS